MLNKQIFKPVPVTMKVLTSKPSIIPISNSYPPKFAITEDQDIINKKENSI